MGGKVTFVSDFKALRTYDPESGWELFGVPEGLEYKHYVLRHPTKPAIEFWGARSREAIDGSVPDGVTRRVFRVLGVGELMPAQVNEETKDLIEAALQAFGLIHDGPVGQLRVDFSS